MTVQQICAEKSTPQPGLVRPAEAAPRRAAPRSSRLPARRSRGSDAQAAERSAAQTASLRSDHSPPARSPASQFCRTSLHAHAARLSAQIAERRVHPDPCSSDPLNAAAH